MSAAPAFLDSIQPISPTKLETLRHRFRRSRWRLSNAGGFPVRCGGWWNSPRHYDTCPVSAAGAEASVPTSERILGVKLLIMLEVASKRDELAHAPLHSLVV